MRLFKRTERLRGEVVTGRAWITIYTKYSGFKDWENGKGLIIHIPLPIKSRRYDISQDEFIIRWRLPVIVILKFVHRFVVMYDLV
jgi:hypothetical protein